MSTSASGEDSVSFRRLTPADFPLLASWLAEPHVFRWWHHDPSPEAVESDFGPTARGEEPAEDFRAEVDGVPIGVLQRCRWHDYPEYVDELAPTFRLALGTLSIDYLIGRPEHTGRGLGPRLLAAAVAAAWERYPEVPLSSSQSRHRIVPRGAR